MGQAELDAFLAKQRTCRVATVSPLGPHLTPLWYVGDGTARWLTSLVSSQRRTDLARDPRVAVLAGAGEAYGELRGAPAPPRTAAPPQTQQTQQTQQETTP
jgi:Pyridoxamine 5'-phosphate oxidase